MNQFVMGVDGGGSKTAAVVLDERGQVLGRGRSSSSNYHLVGLEGVKDALLIAMAGASQQAGIKMKQLAAVTWALAGAGRPADVQRLKATQADLLPGIPGEVVVDALPVLVGGAGTRCGVALIAGTGMIAYGENAKGERFKSGGWGHFFDLGSGYGLAQQALRAVVQAADGRDLPTELSTRILDFLKLTDPSELVDWVYSPERAIAEVAALAPVLLDAAEAGDLVALDVIAAGADALASAVDAASRRLGLRERPFPLVMAGGLLTTNDFYRKVVVQAVHTRVPNARPMQPRADAAVGAALLALESLGHPLEEKSSPHEPTGNTWASEHHNVLTRDLDLISTLQMLGLMHLADRQAIAAVRPNLPTIAKTVDAIAARMSQGGRLIYIGAGTSGRLGALDASECPPTFNTDPDQVVGIIAGGARALSSATEAAEDDRDAGRQVIIQNQIGPNDSVVGIAASGRTPYVAGALEEARRQGALTAVVICNLPAPLAGMADYVIAPLVGPEVITGSTRLKAGTTQKLVLNMLSTGVMVRLGKTFGNLMVDVRQHNAKLKERAKRIVANACDISEAEAGAALIASQGSVKAAIIGNLLGCTPEEAQERLAQANGQIRIALTMEEDNG